MHGYTARFHDYVVIDEFAAGVPSRNFIKGTPKGKRQFFVARLKSAVAKVAQNLRRFLLRGAAIIDNFFRQAPPAVTRTGTS